MRLTLNVPQRTWVKTPRLKRNKRTETARADEEETAKLDIGMFIVSYQWMVLIGQGFSQDLAVYSNPKLWWPVPIPPSHVDLTIDQV